jgi:glucosyl-3-phosphoglycerate phosphatase
VGRRSRRSLRRPRAACGGLRYRSPRLSRLVLVRHGESLWNAEQRLQGHSGTGLSERGHAEAAATAEYLTAQYPDAEIGLRSDLLRVEQTAAPWASRFGGTVTVDPRLREIDVGTWSGLTWAEVEAQDATTLAAWRAGQDVRRGGGETFAELRVRVWDALLDRAAHDGTVIVFTHGGPIRVAVASALGLPPLGERQLAAVANCSVTELIVDDGMATLVAYNRRDHR